MYRRLKNILGVSLMVLAVVMSQVPMPETQAGTVQEMTETEMQVDDKSAHVVTFSMNGGKFSGDYNGYSFQDKTPVLVIDHGKAISSFPGDKYASYSGYKTEADTWYTDQECQEKFDKDISVMKSFTLYKKWYNITSDGTTLAPKGFHISADGTVLYRYDGEETLVKIPQAVTVIADGAFSQLDKNVRGIVLPAGITKIGENAFGSMEGATIVYVYDSGTAASREYGKNLAEKYEQLVYSEYLDPEKTEEIAGIQYQGDSQEEETAETPEGSAGVKQDSSKAVVKAGVLKARSSAAVTAGSVKTADNNSSVTKNPVEAKDDNTSTTAKNAKTEKDNTSVAGKSTTRTDDTEITDDVTKTEDNNTEDKKNATESGGSNTETKKDTTESEENNTEDKKDTTESGGSDTEDKKDTTESEGSDTEGKEDATESGGSGTEDKEGDTESDGSGTENNTGTEESGAGESESSSSEESSKTEESSSTVIEVDPDKEYTVTFDIGISGVSGEERKVSAGKSVSERVSVNRNAAVILRIGEYKIERNEGKQQVIYTFRGWFKDNACTTPWNFDTDVIERNTTIYAKWDKQTKEQPAATYTITFNMNGGRFTGSYNGTSYTDAASLTAKVTAGKGIATTDYPGNGTSTGFKNSTYSTDTNWYKDRECLDAYSGTALNGDLTLYKKWYQTSSGFTMNASKNVLYKYSGSVEDVTIPDSVTIIGSDVFASVGGISSITLPDNIAEVRENAFSGVDKVSKDITITGRTENARKIAKELASQYTRLVYKDSDLSGTDEDDGIVVVSRAASGSIRLGAAISDSAGSAGTTTGSTATAAADGAGTSASGTIVLGAGGTNAITVTSVQPDAASQPVVGESAVVTRNTADSQDTTGSQSAVVSPQEGAETTRKQNMTYASAPKGTQHIKDSTPKTGDPLQYRMLAVCAMFSVGALLLLTGNGKKRRFSAS